MLALGLVMGACTVRDTATSAPSKTTIPDLAPTLVSIVLDVDGLGAVDLGSDVPTVLQELTNRFGEPDRDSDWIPADSPVYGKCPGVAVRAIGWGSFFALFVDEGAGPDTALWFTWTYGFDHDTSFGGVDPRGLDLTTPEGVGIGSTREELRSLYGARLTETGNAAIDVWTFEIDPANTEHLSGLLSGPDETATVQFIERVPGCGNLDAQ